jgi:hypothetical protein
MAVYTTINDPSAHFQTLTWTGDGNDNRAVTNTGNSNLQPDWAWVKCRSTTHDNILFNSVEGNNYNLRTNTSDAQYTNSNYLKSFNSDGLTLGTSNRVNGNGETYVGWQWKVGGGSTSSNSSGSITSNVESNTTAGLHIVKWQGNGTSGATIGHGFTSAPDYIIIKCTSAGSSYWNNNSMLFGTNGVGGPKNMYFNSGDAAQSDNVVRAINATTFEVSNSLMVNSNSQYYIAYCFKNVQGYSRVGKYLGNSDSDGAFNYTGFKPAYVMIKRINSTEDWGIMDDKRSSSSGDNVIDRFLYANANNAEATTQTPVDFYSNGFKCRNTDSKFNASGGTYFYQAFASSPFVGGDSVPTTAK